MSPRLRIAFKRSYNAQRSISLSSPVSQKPKIKDKEQESLSSENNGEIEEEKPKKQMTLAERDAELMRKLEEIAGEGGASGVEYEDGKPASIKKNVKNNFFRYI